MLKLALGVCALLVGMSTQDPDESPQPVITISPIPPRQGGTMEIGYSGKLPVTLEIDWDPAGTPTSVTIPVGGTAKVTVPANATSVIVVDPTPGGAAANGSMIAP